MLDIKVKSQNEFNDQRIGIEIIHSMDYKAFRHTVKLLKKHATEYKVETFFKGRLKQQAEDKEQIKIFVDVAGDKNGDFYRRHCIILEGDTANSYTLDLQFNKITIRYGTNKIICSINENGQIILAKKIKIFLENGKKVETEEEIDSNDVKEQIPNFDLVKQIAFSCNEYHRAKENKEEDR